MTSELSKRGPFTAAILAVAIICSAGATASNILCNTLGPNSEYDSSDGWAVDGGFFHHQVVANPFSLSTAGTVADAVLALGHYAGNNTPIWVFIEPDNAGSPPDDKFIVQLFQAGTIPAWSNGSGGGLVTFDCSGPQCTLGPGSYWLVAFEPDPHAQQLWDFAYQDQMANLFISHGNPFGSWQGPLFMTEGALRIDAAAPEPGSLILLGSGVLGVVGVIRRRFHS